MTTPRQVSSEPGFSEIIREESVDTVDTVDTDHTDHTGIDI